MQRQLLKRSQNRINKSEASFVSTESLELISNLFWTIYNDDCSCSVVQMERWSVFLRIRDDQTHTAHCTQHTTIQASINRNSTMVSTHIRSAEGRKTDTLTHGHNSSYMKFSRVPLHVFWSFTTRKSGGFFVGCFPPLFPRDFNYFVGNQPESREWMSSDHCIQNVCRSRSHQDQWLNSD